MKFTLLFCAIALPLSAGEHVVEPAPFETKLEFEATFLPQNATVLEIKPEQWSKFKIVSLVDHGSEVKKGNTLVEFDLEDYQRHLFEEKEAAKLRKISLAQAKQELADLEITTPRNLAKAKRAFKRAEEAYQHFKNFDRAMAEKRANDRLAQSRQRVASLQEELDQLQKMYADDSVTEKTEEIILKQQTGYLKSAKISLEGEEERLKWFLAKEQPRKDTDQKASFEAAKLKFEQETNKLKSELEKKKLSLAKTIRKDQLKDEELAELEKDSSYFKLNTPTDGTIFYGSIEDGKWSLGSTAKWLFEHGSVPSRKPIMTVIPAGDPLSLHTFLDQEKRLQLKKGLKGEATIKGLDETTFPITLSNIDTYPSHGGKFQVDLAVVLPKENPVTTGMKAKVKVITYQKNKALTVPKSALTEEGEKTTLKIKSTDGKNETREVKVGRKSGDLVEILSGLKEGQVVITPEKGEKK